MKALVFDFGRLLLFPADTNYQGSLNQLHDQLSTEANYKFLNHFKLNLELLNYLTIHTTGLQKYIYTTGDIQDAKEIKQYTQSLFTTTFTQETLGVKTSPESYFKLAQNLNLDPAEIFFADNTVANIQAASQTGLIVHLYQTNTGLINHLKQLLNQNRSFYV